MKGKAVMTTDVRTVRTDASSEGTVGLLLEHRVSGVPDVDDTAASNVAGVVRVDGRLTGDTFGVK